MYCDVCETEMAKHVEPTKMSVIFTTDQTEGRPTTPYLFLTSIDLCVVCMTHVLNGNALFARGAMGYNTYYFKDKK